MHDRLLILTSPSLLVPQGKVILHIYEPRYIDALSKALRQQSPIGSCLLLPEQNDQANALANVGTELLIDDFASDEHGCLLLTVSGGRRFRVIKTHVNHGGELQADIEWLSDDGGELLPEYALLSEILQRIGDYPQSPFNMPADAPLQDARWVSWRLTEWLPLDSAVQQALLQENNANNRLQKLLQLISDAAER